MIHEKYITHINTLVRNAINAILDNDREKANNIYYNEICSIKITESIFCNCTPCYDLRFNYDLLRKLWISDILPEDAKKALHGKECAKYTGFALESLFAEENTEKEFARIKITTSKIIVYLDQNIFSECVKHEKVKNYFSKMKNKGNIQFVYSPSHLEEINKITDSEQQQKFLKCITELTENVCLQPFEDNTISLCIEDPTFPLNRVIQFPNGTDAVEHLKMLNDKSRSLGFPQYDDEEHRKVIGNENAIFHSLSSDDFLKIMSLCNRNGRICSGKEEFKNLKFHKEITFAIYSLHDALDILSFRREKSERTLKSSVHDIEHLIYASKSNFFISKDKNLRDRANQIYSFLGFDVTVQNLGDFFNAQ